MLAFPGPYGSANSAGLHSYGSPTGNFGSRSSGYGVYDVTGSFRIEQTITNTTGSAQNAVFNFFITPGQISSDIGSVLAGSNYVTAGLNFDIQRNGASVWGSSATLLSNAAGNSFTTTGDASLYNGSGAYYSVEGVHRSVDLGVLNAGESIQLSYMLSSFAKGESEAGAERVVEATSYFVPDQWVESCTGGYGGDGYGDGYGGGPVVCTRSLVPAHTVFVPGYTVPGRASGSTAQSGDPFDIEFFNFGGNPLTGDIQFFSIGSSFEPAASVPEPGGLALFLAALGLAGWTTHRKRSQAAAA